MGLIQLGRQEKDGAPDVFTGTLEKAVNWARKGSLHGTIWTGSEPGCFGARLGSRI
jgi:hypothetical protein